MGDDRLILDGGELRAELWQMNDLGSSALTFLTPDLPLGGPATVTFSAEGEAPVMTFTDPSTEEAYPFTLMSAGTTGATAPALAPIGTAATTDETLHFDVQFRDTFLAADPAAMALGDRVILSDLLLADGQEVGHNAGVCTMTNVAGEAI